MNEATARFGRRDALRGVAGLLAGGYLWDHRVASAAEPDADADGRDALTVVIDDLLASNAILSNENVLDALGHISSRHPVRKDHFLMSKARAPALIQASDIMEFDADGQALDATGRHPFLERYIHAAIYSARPDVHAVVHDHSPDVVPFSVSATPLRALAHTGGAIGAAVPVWDIAEQSGAATGMLVSSMDIGRDLAKRLGGGPAVLLRGHGAAIAAKSIRQATFIAITLNLQARLQLAAMQLGSVKYLSKQEVLASAANFEPAAPGDALGRSWEYWCSRARVPFHVRGA